MSAPAIETTRYGVAIRCECGELIEAGTPADLGPMRAGHYLFSTTHERYRAAHPLPKRAKR